MYKIPTIFISYSQTSKEHIDKVMDLAYQLTIDGIDVKIDQWDLKEGQDSINFMEYIESDDIDKVLIILDKVCILLLFINPLLLITSGFLLS